MKRRLVVLSFAFVVALVVASPMQAAWTKHYTVYYNCIISPPYTGVVGEWDVDCDGNWSGWGWEPDHNCTRYEVDYVEWCGPEEMSFVTPRHGSPVEHRNVRALNRFAATHCNRRPPADL